MNFEKGDLINFYFNQKGIFIFREEIRVKDAMESTTGYRYYFLDQAKLKNLSIGLGWVREDYIFPLSFRPSLEEIVKLMLDENLAIRKEAERVYREYYAHSISKNHSVYMD